MESRRHEAYGGIGQVCPWSDALMSREIIFHDVTTAKVSHVDVEHALFQHLDEDSAFVFETKAWLELDSAAVQVRKFKEDWDESAKSCVQRPAQLDM